MFTGPFDHSILRRAQDKKLVEIHVVNIRSFATDAYRSVDGRPFGGGTGMILRVDVVDRALESVRGAQGKKERIILLDPQGKTYNQKKARRLGTFDHLILICGHYEGIDERIRSLVDEEISIGDYIVTGGELPAMVLVDSVVRLIRGVLVKTTATQDESFTANLLEYPQYTHPREYQGAAVPDILLSGHHKAIAKWRTDMKAMRTKTRRPDLLDA